MAAKSEVYLSATLKIVTFMIWRHLVRDLGTDIWEGLAIYIVNDQAPLKFGHINFSVEIVEIIYLCVCVRVWNNDNYKYGDIANVL